jgi:hypothetical protein
MKTWRSKRSKIERLTLKSSKSFEAVVAAVVTKNSVRSENTQVSIIREILVASTMSSLFVALFALVASSFRTRAAVTTENFVRISTGSIWDDDRDCVDRVAINPTDHTGLEGVGVSDPPS